MGKLAGALLSFGATGKVGGHRRVRFLGLVAAAVEAGMEHVFIRKTADEQVGNDDAYQEDDELALPLGVNETWLWYAFLAYNSNATADIKFKWEAPAGAVAHWTLFFQDAPLYGLGTTVVAPGSGADRVTSRWGTVTNGATPGTMQLWWAQLLKNPSWTKVLQDSYIFAVKVS